MDVGFPEDPADLFVRLVSQLSADFNRAETFSWAQDESVADIAELLERAALLDGVISATSTAELLDVVDPDEYPRRLFAVLAGLDRALLYANPYFGGYDQGALTEIAVRYAIHGVLNTNLTEGVLLPRAAFPGRKEHTPNTFWDAFVSVVCVPPAEWARTSHARIRRRNDLTRLERQGEMTIACVPFLDEANLLEWRAVERHARRFFQIELCSPSPLTPRVPELLAELDLSGATIAVLPELALSDELLQAWLRAIAAYPPPAESHLKWILVGTGDNARMEERVNRCVMLDRVTGETILSQDKLYPFTLTPEQLSEWEIVDLLGRDTIEEDIAGGGKVAVAESSLGRIAVLVCEDLARLFELGPMLRNHGVSHIFSPVFSKETKPHHWEHQKAKEYANEVGTLVTVSNSLVIARRVTPDGPWGASMVHSPVTSQVRSAAEGRDIVIFKVLVGDPVPLVGDALVERADDDFGEYDGG